MRLTTLSRYLNRPWLPCRVKSVHRARRKTPNSSLQSLFSHCHRIFMFVLFWGHSLSRLLWLQAILFFSPLKMSLFCAFSRLTSIFYFNPYNDIFPLVPPALPPPVSVGLPYIWGCRGARTRQGCRWKGGEPLQAFSSGERLWPRRERHQRHRWGTVLKLLKWCLNLMFWVVFFFPLCKTVLRRRSD